MQCTYLLTQTAKHHRTQAAAKQLSNDITQGYHITQLFFYADAVAIATMDHYSEAYNTLMTLADQQDIALHICSAGFQQRGLVLSDRAKQDFVFKGLGQFIAELSSVNHVRVF